MANRERATFWPHVCDVYRAVPTGTGVVPGDPVPTRIAQAAKCQITREPIFESVDVEATVSESHARVTFPGDTFNIRNGDWVIDRTTGGNNNTLAIEVKTDPNRVVGERRSGGAGMTTVRGVETIKPKGIA